VPIGKPLIRCLRLRTPLNWYLQWHLSCHVLPQTLVEQPWYWIEEAVLRLLEGAGKGVEDVDR
jgi:hypothetical protein